MSAPKGHSCIFSKACHGHCLYDMIITPHPPYNTLDSDVGCQCDIKSCQMSQCSKDILLAEGGCGWRECKSEIMCPGDHGTWSLIECRCSSRLPFHVHAVPHFFCSPECQAAYDREYELVVVSSIRRAPPKDKCVIL